jgi:hypothetical protein
MLRGAALAALALGLAGCGGSSDGPDEPRPIPGGLGFAADLRSADARSPFVAAGGGAWRCATDGSLQLAISEQGEVAASIGGRTLASVSSDRPLINRSCDRVAREPATRRPSRGRIGATVLRCSVPPFVVVDFAGGDVTVRTAGGRLLAAAAVRPDRVGVAAYWGDGCALA